MGREFGRWLERVLRDVPRGHRALLFNLYSDQRPGEAAHYQVELASAPFADPDDWDWGCDARIAHPPSTRFDLPFREANRTAAEWEAVLPVVHALILDERRQFGKRADSVWFGFVDGDLHRVEIGSKRSGKP